MPEEHHPLPPHGDLHVQVHPVAHHEHRTAQAHRRPGKSSTSGTPSRGHSVKVTCHSHVTFTLQSRGQSVRGIWSWCHSHVDTVAQFHDSNVLKFSLVAKCDDNKQVPIHNYLI